MSIFFAFFKSSYNILRVLVRLCLPRMASSVNNSADAFLILNFERMSRQRNDTSLIQQYVETQPFILLEDAKQSYNGSLTYCVISRGEGLKK